MLLLLFMHSAKSSRRATGYVTCTLNRRLSSSLYFPVGFSIQDEAMVVARSASQGLTAVRLMCANKIHHFITVAKTVEYG